MRSSRAACREMRPAPAAELTRGDVRAAVRARDDWRGFSGGHPPPPDLMYLTHAVARAAASMLPQPVAKSQPAPAAKPRLFPAGTSWKGLGASFDEVSPIHERGG